MCGALDPSETETLWYCTLDAGHTPAEQHETDYMEPDPNNPPTLRPAVHTWTEAA